MLGRIAAATGLLSRLRTAWKRDVSASVDPIRSDLARLSRQIEQLQLKVQAGAEQAARAERQATQVRLTLRLNEQHGGLLAELPSLLDRASIVAHVRRVILDAPLQTDPYPHVVVEPLLPTAMYRLLLKAIPPAAFFGDRDPIKQNLRIPLEFGPALSTRVWDFMDTVIAREAIQPAVMELFREPLRQHGERLFGQSAAVTTLPQSVSGGRVMLRRPGYYLAPHRDPKRSMVTCLLYLARRRDADTYGTEIYRVHDDRESSFAQTYYPEEDGRRCEIVKVVPFRANSMLVFLNAAGAHGARIPPDAPPETERYAYQFYIGPDQEALDALVKSLPMDRQAMWRAKPA
jgi:outer membrane murein-binding lipoprotein Lpp